MDHSEYFCRVKNAKRRRVNTLKIKSVLIKQCNRLVFVKTVQLIFFTQSAILYLYIKIVGKSKYQAKSLKYIQECLIIINIETYEMR